MSEAPTVAQHPGRLARELLASSRRATSVPHGDVVFLSAGDPDFDTPEHVRRALTEAIEAGLTHYAAPYGDPELRAVLAERASARSGRTIEASQVVVTHGASGGLAAAFLASLDPGDRVVIPDPTYSLYADHVRFAGATPVFVRTAADHHLDLDALAAACRGARMLVICNPNNPTGAVLREDEMRAIGELAREHDLLVLADEAYDAIVFDGARFVSALDVEALADRVIYCNTFSKRYAMTGWRVGWVIAPAPLANAAGKVHTTLHGPMNAAVQRASIAALTGSQDSVTVMVDEYARRRSTVMAGLAGLPGVDVHAPEGTFYAFVRYPHPLASTAMQERALEAGVVVRPGSEFGDAGEGHLRLAFTAAPADLEVGLERLRSVLALDR